MSEPNIKAEIAVELYRAAEALGARSDLLRIVGSYGDTMDDDWVLAALRQHNEGGGTPAAIEVTLSQLLLRYFETNPDRLGDFGGTPETTPAGLVSAVLADKFQSPVTPAKTLLQAFDRDQDPTAKEIAALLRRVVG